MSGLSKDLTLRRIASSGSLTRCKLRPRLLMNITCVVTLIGIAAALPYPTAIAAEEAPEPTWSDVWTFQGHDVGHAVTVLDNNVYVVASSGEFPISIRAFILKYGPDGSRIWERYWEDGPINEPHGVAVLDGNLYVAGLTGNSMHYDVFLLKYDPDGNLLWNKTYSRRESAWANGMVVSEGSIYIVGSTGSEENPDAFLSKYDPDGRLIWHKTYSRREGVWGKGVTASGNTIYAVGTTGKSWDLSAFLLKYDSNGRLIWSKTWETAPASEAKAVAVSGSDLYVTGWLMNQYVDVAGVLSNNTGTDSFLLKYDSDGNLIWSKTFGDIDEEEGHAVAVSGGSIYVAGKDGFFQGYGTLLLKYDSDGNLLWNKTYGTTRYGGANGVTISGRYLYAAGVTWGIGAGFYELILYSFDLGPTSIITSTTSSTTMAPTSSPEDWLTSPLFASLLAILAGGLGAAYMIRRRGRSKPPSSPA